MLFDRKLYKIEILKLIKRKDIWVMVTMVGIPMLYSLGVYSNSSIIVYNGENKEYAISFVTSMFHFVYMIFIYFFILSLSTSKSLAGEIENKSILLYSQRINNRKKIYFQKNLSLISIFSVICVVFYILSLAMFYLFAVKRVDIISNVFIVKEELLSVSCIFIAIYLYYIFTINLSLMMSSFMKQNATVIVYSIVFIVMIYLQNFPYIKYLSPSYYISSLSEIIPSNTLGIIQIIIPCIIIHLVYVIIFNIIGIKKFEERDL